MTQKNWCKSAKLRKELPDRTARPLGCGNLNFPLLQVRNWSQKNFLCWESSPFLCMGKLLSGPQNWVGDVPTVASRLLLCMGKLPPDRRLVSAELYRQPRSRSLRWDFPACGTASHNGKDRDRRAGARQVRSCDGGPLDISFADATGMASGMVPDRVVGWHVRQHARPGKLRTSPVSRASRLRREPKKRPPGQGMPGRVYQIDAGWTGGQHRPDIREASP
jgi:hypothetical protein